MAQPESTLSRHDLEAKIVKRCWEDAAFRKEFTADPAGAFTKYLKVPAKDVPKVVVYEETPGSWHIVLPPKPANANELSEADLERVAGGNSAVISAALSNAVKASVAEVSLGISAGAVSAATVASGLVTANQVDAIKGW